MTAFLMIYQRFPTTFWRIPKIFKTCSEGQTSIPEHFRRISENFRRCPKISEDCRRLSRKTQRCLWYTNEFKYNLRHKLDISEIIVIFTCEDIVSFLSIYYHSVYQWLLYNKYCYLWTCILKKLLSIHLSLLTMTLTVLIVAVFRTLVRNELS